MASVPYWGRDEQSLGKVGRAGITFFPAPAQPFKHTDPEPYARLVAVALGQHRAQQDFFARAFAMALGQNPRGLAGTQIAPQSGLAEGFPTALGHEAYSDEPEKLNFPL